MGNKKEQLKALAAFKRLHSSTSGTLHKDNPATRSRRDNSIPPSVLIPSLIRELPTHHGYRERLKPNLAAFRLDAPRGAIAGLLVHGQRGCLF